MQDFGLFIDGRWAPSARGRTFHTTNPATGEVLAVFAEGSGDDVERAVKAASGAAAKWRDVPAPERGEILLKAAWILRERKEKATFRRP